MNISYKEMKSLKQEHWRETQLADAGRALAAEVKELREMNAKLLLQLQRLMASTNWSEICEETESSLALIAKAEKLK